MPRPRPPPTPSSSTDLSARDQHLSKDMEAGFYLPPPAVQQANVKTTYSSHREGSMGSQNTPPISPQDNPVNSNLRHKRTLSGASKSKEDASAQYELPPPPSRARKIIQMKPKNTSAASPRAQDLSQTATQPTKSAYTGSKRKQPSATSAAGRKIARKTAHSIIERRRRSKMNEEFGVLKDMIPACEGVEMHKLAILQAGIEYVRYLEGCIAQLRGGSESIRPPRMLFTHMDMECGDDDDEADEDDEQEDENLEPIPKRSTKANGEMQAAPQTLQPSSNGSLDTIPTWIGNRNSQPVERSAETNFSFFTRSPTDSSAQSPTTTPAAALPSPAFNAIHFSPDSSRGMMGSTATMSMTGISPNILPLPCAAMPLTKEHITYAGAHVEGGAEATATAALMMLTNDRRGTGDSGRGKGMSVRDLLSS